MIMARMRHMINLEAGATEGMSRLCYPILKAIILSRICHCGPELHHLQPALRF